MRLGNTLDRDKETLPSRVIVERKLEDLLAGRISPEVVAQWARPYALGDYAEYADITDTPSWEALTALAMCDGKHSNGEYMYDKSSYLLWLERLRASPAKPKQ